MYFLNICRQQSFHIQFIASRRISHWHYKMSEW